MPSASSRLPPMGHALPRRIAGYYGATATTALDTGYHTITIEYFNSEPSPKQWCALCLLSNQPVCVCLHPARAGIGNTYFYVAWKGPSGSTVPTTVREGQQ